LARAVAGAYLRQRERLGYPLLKPLAERRDGRAFHAAGISDRIEEGSAS